MSIIPFPVADPSGETIDTTYTRQNYLINIFRETFEERIKVEVSTDGTDVSIKLKQGALYNLRGDIHHTDNDLGWTIPEPVRDVDSDPVIVYKAYIEAFNSGIGNPASISLKTDITDLSDYPFSSGYGGSSYRIEGDLYIRPLAVIALIRPMRTWVGQYLQNYCTGYVWMCKKCRFVEQGTILKSAQYMFTFRSNAGTDSHHYCNSLPAELWCMNPLEEYVPLVWEGDEGVDPYHLEHKGFKIAR